ncbi:hypothetical protein F4561_000889 [Lipingzhangella halophila]|uniref:Uncharacterized protein n=1 Tax=Lipingzhangella halophila TaxID=1783352 RepID=A0A7W7RDV2_9ACTN|nr:hypothetical protein [Lipingzhangella halophila]MBB4930069.1 hypothetical protein [Lipingzhangella halophila]
MSAAGTPAKDTPGGESRELWSDRLDRVDWGVLAPDRGKEIPTLLRDLADDGAASGNDPVESLSTLYDIIHYPEPGYLAAPTAVEFLAAIACDPATAPAGRWRPLSLLLELVVPDAAAWLPHGRDIALWRDEVAWVSATPVDEVRAQYQTWLDEASDEQEYRRMASRLAVLSRDDGPALLEAALATHDAARERVADLAGLLKGSENRRSIDGAAEWACYVLAFFPDEAESVLPALTQESSLLIPGDLRSGSTGGDDPLSAELFALGMLARPEHAAVTVALAHQMAGGHLYNGFTAAVALAVIHGERVPQECLRRIIRSGRSKIGYKGLFGDSWPHCGQRSPEQLGFLALGRCGTATRGARVDMLPEVLAGAEGDSRSIVVGTALEMVLGPRNDPHHDPDDYESADFDQDTLKVLWAIAELPEAAWESPGVLSALEAWGLPTERDAFRAFAGVDDDESTESEPEAQAPGQGTPSADTGGQAGGGGLLRRLFGG